MFCIRRNISDWIIRSNFLYVFISSRYKCLSFVCISKYSYVFEVTINYNFLNMFFVSRRLQLSFTMQLINDVLILNIDFVNSALYIFKDTVGTMNCLLYINYRRLYTLRVIMVGILPYFQTLFATQTRFM